MDFILCTRELFRMIVSMAELTLIASLVATMLNSATCFPSLKKMPISIKCSPIIAQDTPDVQGAWEVRHYREFLFMHPEKATRDCFYVQPESQELICLFSPRSPEGARAAGLNLQVMVSTRSVSAVSDI